MFLLKQNIGFVTNNDIANKVINEHAYDTALVHAVFTKTGHTLYRAVLSLTLTGWRQHL